MALSDALISDGSLTDGEKGVSGRRKKRGGLGAGSRAQTSLPPLASSILKAGEQGAL